ncbi:unnamed protein product [Rhizophagus irregularis]|nr:unnamed protein product [Rhizophagus irregularis]
MSFISIHLVNNIQLNNKQECIINYLKVQVKGKKVYGDWKIKEVAKIYNDAFTSIETLHRFKIDTLPEASPLLESNELEDFVKQLKKKCYAFQAITSNEATTHKFN